jgi:hypothetical protein
MQLLALAGEQLAAALSVHQTCDTGWDPLKYTPLQNLTTVDVSLRASNAGIWIKHQRQQQPQQLKQQQQQQHLLQVNTERQQPSTRPACLQHQQR